MFPSDAHKALFGCNHLGCITMMLVASCIPFPFSTPCDDMLTLLVFAPSWLCMHLYTLAYMSMHESYLLVRCPCFNTIKLWTFNSNLHLSLANTTFCLFPCLFAFLFVCSLSCLFVCSLICSHPFFYACYVYHVYLLYASLLCFLHLFLP